MNTTRPLFHSINIDGCLPIDLLLEILARLPVKPLLRFKSVSKSWKKFLQHPTFITKHHLTQAGSKCRLFTRIDSFSKDDTREFILLSDQDNQSNVTHLDPPLLIKKNQQNLFKKPFQVALLCNGIVFIFSHHFSDLDLLILWNPATRQYKVLPAPSSQYGHQPSFVGFGVNPITNDYNVVRIGKFMDMDRAELLSVSATHDSSCTSELKWKIVDAPVPHTSPYKYPAGQVYLNGKHYWCTQNDARTYCQILWFDMGAQVFGLIESDILNVARWGRDRLVAFKDSIGLIMEGGMTDGWPYYQIWKMDDDDGVSWTKYATVGPVLQPSSSPVGLWRNDQELILQVYDDEYGRYTYRLGSYDIKTQKIKEITDTQGIFLDGKLPPAIYNESIVSFMGSRRCLAGKELSL